jgi:TPR repeat protein
LGYFFENGLGVTTNLVEAFKWYSLAGRKSQWSAARLEVLKPKLSLAEVDLAEKRANEFVPKGQAGK